MNKILYFLIISILFSPLAFSKEPTLAILKAIYSNSNQKFSIRQYTFLCKPYGIVTLDELYAEATPDSSCKKSIDKFYIQNPHQKYFTANLLKLKQTYHVEFRNNRCILYAKGLNTLSELLLAKGLAISKSMFKDEEFKNSFIEAQIEAKANNIGIYKNKIKYKCIAELFAVEKKNP